MAYAGPTSLIIEDVPLDPITSLGDIERHFTGAEGYIGAKISNTRLNSTARIVQNFVFEFSSAADAAQAFQSRSIITVADRAYTVIPNGGFFDAERHVEDNVQPNQDQPNASNVKKEPTDALKSRENGNGPQDDSEVEADTNLDDDDEPEPEGPNVSRDQEANEAITDGAHTRRDFDSVHNGLEQSSEPADNPGFAALLIAIDIRDVQSDTAKEESSEQGGAQDIAAHVACGDGGPTTVPGGGPSASDGIHHTVVVVGPNGGGRGNNTIMANEALQPQTQATAGTSNTQEPASSDAISPSLPEFDDNATPDLDDPDLEDWEEDFDLGNEPRDEQWDVWGCRHRFQTFSTAGIPDFWLVGVDARKDDRVEIECMSCFKKVAVLKDDCGSKSDGSSSPPETQDQPGVVVQVKKSGTWKCKLCGVIYCKRCVKVAKKRIMRERISADQ
ncbi:hypothetical protein H2204_007899 [Knufia peltigerae]|uniref:Uncharacterized protein n=1 Tax=Knufia peltigerae TaxID=1002370 RepID=A0AA39CXI4_9EURO|nr:hypothetical protein H2204_007899 [Knufia peltigerae]